MSGIPAIGGQAGEVVVHLAGGLVHVDGLALGALRLETFLGGLGDAGRPAGGLEGRWVGDWPTGPLLAPRRAYWGFAVGSASRSSR